MKPSQIIVVLPAYNEEGNIASLLARIHCALREAGLCYQVVVVNDGSSDRTEEILQLCASRYPLSLHRHERNMGYGATIRDGLTVAAESADPSDIIVTMDADESHNPGLVARMVQQIREGYDVVIASRFRPGARVYGLSLPRRLLSIGASVVFRILFPTRGIRDFTCGYRAFRASVLKRAFATHGATFVDQEGFQSIVDIVLKLRRMNVIFGEVPMVLRYDLKAGVSKMRVLQTVRLTVNLIARRRFGG